MILMRIEWQRQSYRIPCERKGMITDHMEPTKIHSFIHVLTVNMLTEKMNELKKK